MKKPIIMVLIFISAAVGYLLVPSSFDERYEVVKTTDAILAFRVPAISTRGVRPKIPFKMIELRKYYVSVYRKVDGVEVEAVVLMVVPSTYKAEVLKRADGYSGGRVLIVNEGDIGVLNASFPGLSTAYSKMKNRVRDASLPTPTATVTVTPVP